MDLEALKECSLSCLNIWRYLPPLLRRTTQNVGSGEVTFQEQRIALFPILPGCEIRKYLKHRFCVEEFGETTPQIYKKVVWCLPQLIDLFSMKTWEWKNLNHCLKLHDRDQSWKPYKVYICYSLRLICKKNGTKRWICLVYASEIIYIASLGTFGSCSSGCRNHTWPGQFHLCHWFTGVEMWNLSSHLVDNEMSASCLLLQCTRSQMG